MRWILGILVLTVAIVASGQGQFDAIPSTSTATNTDLILVQTNSAGAAGQKFTRSITLSNLARVLNSFGIISGGGTASIVSNSLAVSSPSGGVTNAFRIIRVETNQAHILSNIVQAASSGDVIQLGAGDFYIDKANLRLPVGVTLEGHGKLATRIHSGAPLLTNGPIVILSSTSALRRLEIVPTMAGSWYQAAVGFYSEASNNAAATNAIISEVLATGQTDSLYLWHTNEFSVDIDNSEFLSKWDAVVVRSGNSTVRTNFVRIKNSRIVSDLKGATHAVAISTARASPVRVIGGHLALYGCDITATNANRAAAITTEADNSIVDVIGGTVRAAGTNSAVIADTATYGSGPEFSTLIFRGVGVTQLDLEPGTIATFEHVEFTTARMGTNYTAGPVLADSARVTNNVTLPGNVVSSGSNIVSGAFRLPSIATNTLLFIGGQSNVVGLGLGSGLSVSGGNLASSGGITTNGNQFLGVPLAIKDAVPLTNAVLRGDTTVPSGNSLTVHAFTNTAAGAFQHSMQISGRVIRNIEKLATSIPIGNSSGPDYSIKTNDAVTFTYSGSPIHGQRFSLIVSNYATTNLPVGFPSAFSPQIGSNVTSWTVAPSNYVVLPFIYSTNDIGGGMWILDRVAELEATLGVASAGGNGFLVQLTNSPSAPGAMVVVSNSYMPQASSMVLSNLAGASQYFTNGQASSMVLSNLVGTVANNVTNEDSTAIQINTGTLTLSPSVLSNILASGHGAPYIAINTNSGALANITNLVIRSGIVVSNDSAGIASLHVQPSSGTDVITNRFASGNTFTNLGNSRLTRITQPWVALTLTDSTNCIIDLSLGNRFYIVLATNIHFDTPTGFPGSFEAQDLQIKVIQNSTGAYNWWFNTNTWKFFDYPYLPIDTNAGRFSYISAFTSTNSTIDAVQITGGRP